MDRSKSPRAWYLTLQIAVSTDVWDPDTRKQPENRLVLARPSQEIKVLDRRGAERRECKSIDS